MHIYIYSIRKEYISAIFTILFQAQVCRRIEV